MQQQLEIEFERSEIVSRVEEKNSAISEYRRILFNK